jgi:hypothetical protein
LFLLVTSRPDFGRVLDWGPPEGGPLS